MSDNYLEENGVNIEESLNYLGDMDTYRDIMSDFIDDINDKITNLREYKDNNDVSNYAITAHSVKSEARYLGFTELASIALQHEMAGKEANQAFINENYASFIDKINYFVNIANNYLGK